jgi:hypothetical protein
MDILKQEMSAAKIEVTQEWDSLKLGTNTWNESDGLERLTAFEEYIKDLEKAEYQSMKLKKQRQGRLAREAFSALLSDLFGTREVTHKSHWHSVAKKISKYPAYLQMLMLEEGSSTPKDLFDEFCKAEKDTLKQHKDSFKSLVKQHQIRFPPTVTFTEFNQALQQYEPYAIQINEIKALLHEYYKYKVQ